MVQRARFSGIIRAGLRQLGLIGLVRGLREHWRVVRWLARNRSLGRAGSSDGWPVPGSRLMLRVSGIPDAAWFLASGRLGAETVRGVLARRALTMEQAAPVLDFGCGCGRVARHWSGAAPGAVHGLDVDRQAIAWCRRHLPFARFDVNWLTPPVSYADSCFGLVYAFSVLTHLPAELQQPWLVELSRILRPGGVLLLSTHGSRYRSDLSERERERFDRGELVVKRGDSPGDNVCGAYHPEPYVRSAVGAATLSVVEFLPEGALGNPFQDLWVLEKVAAGRSSEP